MLAVMKVAARPGSNGTSTSMIPKPVTVSRTSDIVCPQCKGYKNVISVNIESKLPHPLVPQPGQHVVEAKPHICSISPMDCLQ